MLPERKDLYLRYPRTAVEVGQTWNILQNWCPRKLNNTRAAWTTGGKIIDFPQKYKFTGRVCFQDSRTLQIHGVKSFTMLQHPAFQTKSKHVRYLACEDFKSLMRWTVGIRLAKVRHGFGICETVHFRWLESLMLDRIWANCCACCHITIAIKTWFPRYCLYILHYNVE